MSDTVNIYVELTALQNWWYQIRISAFFTRVAVTSTYLYFDDFAYSLNLSLVKVVMSEKSAICRFTGSDSIVFCDLSPSLTLMKLVHPIALSLISLSMLNQDLYVCRLETD